MLEKLYLLEVEEKAATPSVLVQILDSISVHSAYTTQLSPSGAGGPIHLLIMSSDTVFPSECGFCVQELGYLHEP